jgi:hypothetical protein
MKLKYVEIWYPFCLSLIITTMSFFWFSKYITFNLICIKLVSDSVLSVLITIQSALFGFFLTILALLLQMNNKAINMVKEFEKFPDLVRFSKKAVYSSLIVIFISIFILLTKNVPIDRDFKTLTYYFFGFILLYNTLSSYRFVGVFYLLAKSN